MYHRSFSKSLNYKLRELALIVKHLETEEEPSRIDLDLALEKTRQLYDILVKINSGWQQTEQQDKHRDPEGKPVVPSDPEMVEDDKLYEAEGIIPSPVHLESPERPGKQDIPDTQNDHDNNENAENETETASGTVREISGRENVKNPGKEKPGENIDDHKNSGQKEEKRQDYDKTREKEQKTDIEIVADRYQTSQNYINQAIARKKSIKDLTTKLQSKPISDLRSSIGLNDKFLFIKELFKGRPEKYNQCIDNLDQATSFEEAINFLNSNYNWDDENDVAEKLINLIKRKHQIEED